MRTKNLLFITIVGLSVAFTSAAFGQNTTKKKRPKAKPKATTTTTSSQRNSPGTPAGTPLPVIGDVLDGVGIRSANPNQPAGTPKPYIGDVLDGVGIRSNGGGQGQTPANLPNPNTLPNGIVQNGASLQAMDPLVKLRTQTNGSGEAGQASRESTANPPSAGQTNNILPYIEPANLKKPNTPGQTTVTGQNSATSTTAPARPKPKTKTKRKH